MKAQDEVYMISNPHLLAGVYFALLAIIFTLGMDELLYLLGIDQIIPVGKAILLAAIVAACFGALYAERIIYSEPPYNLHVFMWAFLMVITALPIYTIGFVYLLQENHPELFVNPSLFSILYLYVVTLLYNFLLAGVWLALIAGLAAIYLRKHVVYYIVQSLNQRRSR